MPEPAVNPGGLIGPMRLRNLLKNRSGATAIAYG
jgi:hypothetical protein